MSHACHRFWNCYKTLTFWSLLTIPCACHAKRHLNLQKWSVHGVFCTFWLRNVLRATPACTFSTSQPPKVVRSGCVCTFWLRNVLRAATASGPELVCIVHFDFEMCFAPQRRAVFRHRNPLSAPNLMCFVHFYVGLCFAPQRRALFRHPNFQQCSEGQVFCAFLLRNVLRATTACNFSSLIWPAGSAPAALASRLFDPPEPQTIGKTQCFATFLPFSRTWIFFLLRLSLFWYSFFFLLSSFFFLLFSCLLFSCLLFSSLLFSSLTLPTSAFHLSILSEVWFLNFPRSLGLSSCMLYPILFAICMTSHCGRPRGKLTENLPLAPLAPLAFVARGWNHLFLPQVEQVEQAEQAGQVAEIT